MYFSVKKNEMESIEQISYYNGQKYNSLSHLKQSGKMHGVKRVLVFCFMVAILPSILILIPLYLRHSVFADVAYTVAESDVQAIHKGISSVFCDSVTLQMNSSFNAFQLLGTPQLSEKRKHIRLKKSMILPDDTLEYWGFYLLKGAVVKLKVCSRYDGSRILVVRGDKNLNTCGLLNHNINKYGAKMDVEHSRVRVTYDKQAEVLGFVDKPDFNKALEDNTEEKDSEKEIQSRILKGKAKKNNKLTNSSQTNSDIKNLPIRNVTVELTQLNKTANIIKHHKRHIKNKRKIEKLRKILDEDRIKRNIGSLDAHIKHGGNAFNNSFINNDESNSVSSFETDLLICYDGKILLTDGFKPSKLCNDTAYLDETNHMTTEHMVASNGYYYYIFYSDNDFFKNDIHAVFDIYKPTYRLANSSSGSECINQTKCIFPIGFLSDENIIVEVPTRDGIEHEEDDLTLLTTTCHPRMGVYIIFPILVLILVLTCAFL